MMIRSFLPVGQGAFYCESFVKFYADRNLNVVYDCGSTSNIEIVNKAIREQFHKGEIIDAVFISHLDEDHINGLPYLLEYCFVKKIYFPLVSAIDKAIMKIYFEINKPKEVDKDFTYNFLDNPRRAIENIHVEYNKIELIPIKEREEEWNNIDIQSINSGENVFEDISKDSNKVNFDNMYEWLYIPFNFRQSERKKKLLAELESKFERRISESELESLWRNGQSYERQRIKEAYMHIQGSLNTNSMTVFSGVSNLNLMQMIMWSDYICKEYCCCGWNYKPSGCLYTGDFDASGREKWNCLKTAYDKYWNYIGCVQVPHHGSKYNFNKEMLKLDVFYVISAGTSNRYKHPHASVLKDFICNQKMPFVITENEKSAIRIMVEKRV